MKKVVTFERADWEMEEPGADYFKHAINLLESMREDVEEFAECHNTREGAVLLSQINRNREELYDLYGYKESPFSHHSMDRLRRSLGVVMGEYGNLRGNGTGIPKYRLGRGVEQAMDALDARIEEFEQCHAYATSNSEESNE